MNKILNYFFRLNNTKDILQIFTIPSYINIIN